MGWSHRFLPYTSYSDSKREDKRFAIYVKDKKIRINNFRNLHNVIVPNVAFFFTDAYIVTVVDFMEHNFLKYLARQKGWRLYIPEIVLEYLRYLQKVRHSIWSRDLPSDVLDRFVESKQIRILREVPETVPDLNPRAIVTASIENGHPEYLFRDVYLKSYEVSMPTPKNPVVSLSLKSAIKLSNQVFPEFQDEDVFNLSCISHTFKSRLSFSWRTSRQESFRIELERLRTRIQEKPNNHYEIGIIAPNEFVVFWYLRQFWIHLKLKTHATLPMAEFAWKFFPNAKDYIFADNSDEKCRIHYDCSSHTSNELCMPSQEWAIEFEVERILIGQCHHSVEEFNEFEMHEHEHRLKRPFDLFQFPFIHPEYPECDHTGISFSEVAKN